VGVEPTTRGLKVRCSAIELEAPNAESRSEGAPGPRQPWQFGQSPKTLHGMLDIDEAVLSGGLKLSSTLGAPTANSRTSSITPAPYPPATPSCRAG
jgi:hypothetical protein